MSVKVLVITVGLLTLCLTTSFSRSAETFDCSDGCSEFNETTCLERIICSWLNCSSIVKGTESGYNPVCVQTGGHGRLDEVCITKCNVSYTGMENSSTIAEETTVISTSSTGSSASEQSSLNSSTTSASSTSGTAPHNNTSASIEALSSTSTLNETETVTPTPKSTNCRKFDAASFVGGIVLAIGFFAIGYLAYRCYKSRHAGVPYSPFP
jgi:hypothetical protein